MLDGTKLSIVFGLLAIFIGLLLLGYFVYVNPGSRNISLAVAALFGAAVILAVNLWLDLRGSVSKRIIPIEYTIDKEKPRIRQ